MQRTSPVTDLTKKRLALAEAAGVSLRQNGEKLYTSLDNLGLWHPDRNPAQLFMVWEAFGLSIVQLGKELTPYLDLDEKDFRLALFEATCKYIEQVNTLNRLK